MNIRKVQKKILFLVFYILIVFSFFVFVDYLFYRSYLNRSGIPTPRKEEQLPPYPKVKNMNPSTLLRLGHVMLDKTSSFVNFETPKADGVIRIGCFGDSFTYGDEVNGYNDYPQLLQNIFKSQGYNNVEVINFGSSWHGFHQAFIMWKYVGEKYNLDYVLLGPGCFQYERDSNFNHTGRENIYYFHSRYILEDQHVKLIDVIGRTHTERMRSYYRFIPRDRYFKYDVQAPLFLKCLLPKGRQLKNPFYYHRGSVEEEILETYRRLLTEMADSGVQIILGNYTEKIVELGEELNRKNLFSTLLPRPLTFPYMATKTHNSHFGNSFVAQLMFNFLTRKPNLRLEVLKLQAINTDLPSQTAVLHKELDKYSQAEIKFENKYLGNFVQFRENNIFNKVIKTFPSQSILILKNNNGDTLNSCFLPINFELLENMNLTLIVQTKDGNLEKNLGHIELLVPGLNLGQAVIEEIDFNYFFKKLHLKNDNLINNSPNIQDGDTVKIFLNNQKILNGIWTENNNLVELFPVENEILVAGVNFDHSITFEGMSSSGNIYLTLTDQEGKEINIPLSEWIKVERQFPYDQENNRIVPIRN